MSINVENEYRRIVDAIIEKSRPQIEATVNKIQKETWSDFICVVEEKVRTIFNSVIQDFYSSYTPEYYDRRESMYNILQTEISENSLSISFDPSKMTSFRSGYDGEDGLYDQVFRHGWHGGAPSGDGHPSSGSPYWRAPVPYYNQWGREASIASVSPLDDFRRRISDYQKYQMHDDFNKLWSLHTRNLKTKG